MKKRQAAEDKEWQDRYNHLRKHWAKKFGEIKHERELEKKVVEMELGCTKDIRDALTGENARLKEELVEVKKILMIPRLHFKHIEKHDFESLKEQFEIYN